MNHSSGTTTMLGGQNVRDVTLKQSLNPNKIETNNIFCNLSKNKIYIINNVKKQTTSNSVKWN